MTRHPDPAFDDRIADWLEGLDDRAPSGALDAVLAASRSIPQQRAWRAYWRSFPMNRISLIGTTVAVGLVLLVGGILVIPRSGSPGVGGPAATTSPSAAATPPRPIIPDGTYLGAEQQVADILQRLEGNPTLSAGEKATITDSILGIREATTFQVRIEINGDSMVVSQGVDGTFIPEQWTITPLAEKRIAATWSSGMIEFEVRGCGLPGSGCGFTLQALSPVPSEVEAFVRKLIFEISGPFAPVV